ncbi:MAG: cysteine desulfurase family protein [bacterium]|nr:cysteine desulfurase family protein [bacterium]
MQVYLDNSATTRPIPETVEAMNACMLDAFYNPSALYAPAMQAERALADARRVIAASLQANEKNVIFTSGGTESDNLAIFGLLAMQREKGDVLYTAAEHAAVKNACLEAEKRLGMTAREIPLLPNGSVDLSALREMLSENTRLICVMQVCNETGVIMPISDICALRDELAEKAAIHVDGVQGYLRVPFSFKQLKVQSYALSAHKFHGPKGVGALVIRDGVRIQPQMAGGGQQNDLRSGTENTYAIAGMRAAVEHYPADAMQHMLKLKQLLLNQLAEALPETTVLGLPADDAHSAGHILNVAFPPVRAETLLHALEADGVLVGTGSACSSKKGKHSSVLKAMGQKPNVMEAAIRISLCPFNTEEEMRFTAEKIIEKVTMLRKFVRR